MVLQNPKDSEVMPHESRGGGGREGQGFGFSTLLIFIFK